MQLPKQTELATRVEGGSQTYGLGEVLTLMSVFVLVFSFCPGGFTTVVLVSFSLTVDLR